MACRFGVQIFRFDLPIPAPIGANTNMTLFHESPNSQPHYVYLILPVNVLAQIIPYRRSRNIRIYEPRRPQCVAAFVSVQGVVNRLLIVIWISQIGVNYIAGIVLTPLRGLEAGPPREWNFRAAAPSIACTALID
jgi:hypothetical protein